MAMASAIARCPAPIIPHAAYFTRGSGHNEKAQYTEREDDYVNNMDRLAHKFEVMRQFVPAAGDSGAPRAPKSASSRSARPTTRCAKAAISCATNTISPASYLRLKAYPFTAQLLDFIRRHDRVYVVDQNRDAPAARR